MISLKCIPQELKKMLFIYYCMPRTNIPGPYKYLFDNKWMKHNTTLVIYLFIYIAF